MKVNKLFLVFLMTIWAGQTLAYDAETHGLITYAAFQRSRLSGTGSGSVVYGLGIDRLNDHLPFHIYWDPLKPDYYYDSAYAGGENPVSTFPRQPSGYEQCQMQNLASAGAYSNTDTMLDDQGKVGFLPIQNWLIRGVMREDDISSGAYVIAHEKCGVPDSDPNGEINRVLNHFYDPIHDRAFTPTGVIPPCSLVAPNGVCIKSVDWSLGYVDSFASPPQINVTRRNHFTWEDARLSMWNALTGQKNRPAGQPNQETSQQRYDDAIARLYSWATAFRSLGSSVHLLEDGAQPQHVRNDPHGPIIPSGEQQAYEGYTNARVLHTQSGINTYLKDYFPNGVVSIPPINLGDYKAVSFATPQRFFSTRNAGDSDSVPPDNRKGLIDYANRGFFTGGTLPTNNGNGFPKPDNHIDTAHQYTEVSAPCVLAQELTANVTNLHCRHWTHDVPDLLQGMYVDNLPAGFSEPPLVMESVYRVIRAGSHITSAGNDYAVGIEEFQAAANLAIPRAIAYTQGLIDYFFRDVGGLVVTAPASGAYAVLDHGQTHSMNSQGYPCASLDSSDGCTIFGFKSIDVNIKKTASPMVDMGTGAAVPQNFANGSLVAVARYHRNTCYQPDLSGSPSRDANAVFAGDSTVTFPQNCSTEAAFGSGRSTYPEISVSTKIAVDADGKFSVGGDTLDLNSGSPTLVRFDFADDPIPVNATDLFIQVVFKGQIGDTLSGGTGLYEIDGIATGSVDVSEPTYETFMNLSGFYYSWGTTYPPFNGWSSQQAGPYTPTNIPTTGTLNVCLGDSLLASVSPQHAIAPAAAVRLALILDPNAADTTNMIVNYPNCFATPNADGSCPVGDEILDWGFAGTVGLWMSSSIATSDLDSFDNFAVHIDQSSAENNADSPGGFAITPITAGAGVNWGDNFYFSFGRNVGNGHSIGYLSTPFPPSTLAGVGRGVVASPLSVPPDLANVQPLICELNTYYTVPYW